MSDGFQPSVTSARAALGDSTPLVQRPHPIGKQGAKLSLEEVARRVREGRLDPRVRAWAGEALIKAGRPKGARDQAQALLDAVRAQAMYVPDPVGAEMIVAAKNTLCLDDQGLCIRVADCDDLCVALGSALMSIGIPTKIVGQAFDSSGVPSHVLLAVETKAGWKKVDPSSDKFRVGESFPATREWFLDPMDTVVSLSGGQDSGDFVGVGRTPAAVLGLGEGSVGIWVYKSDVEAEKARVNAKWISLAADVDTCWGANQITPDQVRAFYVDKNTWDLYNEKDVSYFGLPSQMVEVNQFEQLVYQWQLKFKGVCTVQAPVVVPPLYANPSLLPAPLPPLSPEADSTIRTVAVAGAIVAGSIAAIYGIGLAMQAMRNKPAYVPVRANPNEMNSYEIRFRDPLGRERVTVVSTEGDEKDAVAQVRGRYGQQSIRILYVHAD